MKKGTTTFTQNFKRLSMKTKLFSFLLVLFCSMLSAQISVTESFELGSIPSGWTVSNFSIQNNGAVSCDGSKSLSIYLTQVGQGGKQTGNVVTQNYTSNGEQINFSIGYNKNNSSAGFTGNIKLLYAINNSGTFVEFANSTSFPSNCFTGNGRLTGTIAAGVVTSGSLVKFKIEVNHTTWYANVNLDALEISQNPSTVNQTIAEYNFNGTYNNLLGTAPFNSNAGTSFTTDRNGNTNSALNISNTGTSATINGLPYGNSSRTVSFWAKLNVIQSPYNMTFSYGQSSNNSAIGGSFNSMTVDYFGYANNFSASSSNSPSTWYHFVYVYDGTTAKIYKDGVMLASQAKTWNTINNNNIFKLGIGVGGELNFDGAIDDLKIFNYVLTDTEINNLYTYNALAPSTGSAIYNFTFDNSYYDVTSVNCFATAGTFTTDRSGNINSALQLNSLGTEVSLPNLPIGNASRSVSVWIKMNSYLSDNFLFSYGSPAVNQAYGFSLKSNLVNNYAWANDLTHATSIPLSTWKHLVVTFDTNTDLASIYLDGVLITSAAKPDWNTANITNFYLGRTPQGANSFNGVVDDLKIYNYALSQTEITNLYNNNTTLEVEGFNQNNLEVNLYPNPVRDILNIETILDILSVEIYNVQGQKVMQSNHKQVNVSDLAAGIYMVKMEDVNNNMATKKIVIK